MGDYLKGMTLGVGVGIVIGMIIVAKNKKLAGKISEGVDTASKKIQEAKEMIGEKIEECQQRNENKGQEDCGCQQPKKSKNC